MRRLLLLALLASIADPFSLSDLLDDDGIGEDDEEYFIWVRSAILMKRLCLAARLGAADPGRPLDSGHLRRVDLDHFEPCKEKAEEAQNYGGTSKGAGLSCKYSLKESGLESSQPTLENRFRSFEAEESSSKGEKPTKSCYEKTSGYGSAARKGGKEEELGRRGFSCSTSASDGSKEDTQAPPAPPQPLPPPTPTKQTERKPFCQDNRTDLSSSKEDSHHSQKLEIPVTVNTTQASFEPLKRAAGTREKLRDTPVSRNPQPNPPLIAVTPEAVDAPKVGAKIQTPSSPGTIVAQPSTDGFEKKPENLENRPEKLPATVTCGGFPDTPKGSDKTESPSSNVEDHGLVNNGSPADTQPEKLPKSTCDTPKAPSSPGSASFMNI
ncbi:unnamed protein product, partial [Mesorhabditis spiculigera]